MNTQEIYNHVRDHLLKQNARCSRPVLGGPDGDEACLYRGEGKTEGMKCAAGSLVTDADYNRSAMEGASCYCIRVRDAMEKFVGRSLADEEMHLISEMQHMHDKVSVEQWPTNLATIARQFGLHPGITP